MAEIKWIKITTNIFSDEKILLIEQMPDADTILVIWFKLLCMAGRENNYGVFLMNGNRIPYTDEMLSTIFRRPLNTVRLALTTFEAFGMIDIEDSIISIPNWEKHQNIEGLEKIREQTKERVARYREKQNMIACNVTETYCNETEEDKEEEKEKNKIKNKNKEHKDYCPYDEKLNQTFIDYIKMRKQIKSPMTERAIELAISKLSKLATIPFSDVVDNDLAIKILEQSIMNSWKGLFELKEEASKSSGQIDWSKV